MKKAIEVSRLAIHWEKAPSCLRMKVKDADLLRADDGPDGLNAGAVVRLLVLPVLNKLPRQDVLLAGLHIRIYYRNNVYMLFRSRYGISQKSDLNSEAWHASYSQKSVKKTLWLLLQCSFREEKSKKTLKKQKNSADNTIYGILLLKSKCILKPGSGYGFRIRIRPSISVPDCGMRPAMASGCRTGPPSFIGWRTGTTTLRHSRLHSPISDSELGLWMRATPCLLELEAGDEVVVCAVCLVLAAGAWGVGDGRGKARRVSHQALPQLVPPNVRRTWTPENILCHVEAIKEDYLR
jgi:hypothetical protein